MNKTVKYLFSRFSSASASGIYNAIINCTQEEAENYLKEFIDNELKCRLQHEESGNDKLNFFDIKKDDDGEIVGHAEFTRTDGQGVDTFIFQFTPMEDVKELILL